MLFPYKHIIWDWNGTLLDDAWLCVEVLNGLLKGRGRQAITTDDYRARFGFPVIHFYDSLGFEVDLDSFQQVSREFIGAYEARWLAECALQPGAEAMLERLSGHGISHSVLSAAQQEALEIGINHFGIARYFTGLAGTNNIYAEGKVARGIEWVKTLPCAPAEVVLVGDTLHDFEVAEAIGTDCILLAHGHHNATRLASSGAPVAETMADLADLLEAGPAAGS